MTEVGANYGGAMYALAREEQLAHEIHQQLHTLQESFASAPEFIQLLCAPSLTKAERCKIVDDSFRGRVHPYVLNFLKLLTEKGYMRYFSDCCNAYHQQYYADENILCVDAVTAVKLTPAQERKLTQKLHQLTGQQIQLNSRIDPTILGGVRLDYQGKRLDDTVSHRLSAIRDILTKTVLE